MEILEVTTPKHQKEFLQIPVFIYKKDDNWIRPLDKDINEVFNESTNKTFRFGKLIRWILKDQNGQPVGRIAAFTNKRYKNKNDDVPVGGVGFFECINNSAAANLLLDTAKKWLTAEGMEAMDGPINFGERDRWWGMVTRGFQEPLYCMNYNPPYYVDLFTAYGFKTFYNQICLDKKPKEKLEHKIWDRHQQLEKNADFSASYLRKKDLAKYAADFSEVYNKAWAGHGGLKQMSTAQVLLMFKKMKPVMDEKIIWFAYHKTQPIAIFVNLPDLNQWFKYLNGKFGLIQKIKFLWLKKFLPNRKFTGLVFGVVPEWQGKGIDAYLIGESAKIIQSDEVPYTHYEMQWIGDFNPKMINIATGLGNVQRSRELTTFRYLFDREKVFQRHPMLN